MNDGVAWGNRAVLQRKDPRANVVPALVHIRIFMLGFAGYELHWRCRMKKTTLLVSFFLFAAVCTLPAVMLNDIVLGVTMHPDFALNMFPVAIEAEFSMPGLEFNPGNSTSLTFTMNAGYTPRWLTQDPRTGAFLTWDDTDSTLLSDNSTTFSREQAEYSALFSAWSLALSQGLAYSPITKGDLITATVSFDGRWEQAMERLEASRHADWALGGNLTFSDNSGTRSIFSGPLLGTPDLQGNRYMLSTSLNAGITINLQNETNTTLDGIEIEASGLWAPWWLFNDLQWFDGTSDYWMLSAALSAGHTLYQKRRSNGYNTVSLVLSDDLSYRWLDGNKIPKFAETGGIWGVSAQNLTHALTNSLKLSVFGPQFIAQDCYPYAYAFLDMGYASGYLNNTGHSLKYSNFMGSTGVHVHLRLFGIFHVFYEIGYIFGPEINAAAGSTSPGTLGFYISLED
jgi:hypothetical protein